MAEAIPSFGSWLRRRRKALDLTQDALAGLVGCSKDLIVKIEGEARRPSREIAALLATHLQLAAEERDDFIRCARAELAADRLPPPTASVPRPAFARAATIESAPKHYLPLQISSFLGREREIAELSALIGRPDRRLVTLTGPGGTGKTRLALQVAAAVAAEYPDGVWFVDLAPISDPQQVAPAIMQALGIRELPDRTPQERLAQWLAPKQLLLVLDNFEQILNAAQLVVTLLQAAPQLTILVTSRVPLRLRGEQEYPVLPLGLPSISVQAFERSNAQTLNTDLTQYESVRLFIERARAVRPDFQVTNVTAPAIAEICHRLDGLPLAIELAASRIRMFPPEVLLERLQQAMLPTLSGGARDLPARQQTIQATIDWSYRLLTPAQQRLFTRLGVFVGGWTLAAAEFVGAEDGVDVAAELHALVEHSLVRVVETGSDPRYTMLETIREGALAQYQDALETQQIRLRHCEYYCTLGEVIGSAIDTIESHVADRLQAEKANIRGAVEWAAATDQSSLGIQLCYWFYSSWSQRAELAWIEQLFQQFLGAVDHLPIQTQAYAHDIAGRIAHINGHMEKAETHYLRSVDLYTVDAKFAACVHQYQRLAEVAPTTHAAHAYIERGHQLAMRLSEPALLALILRHVAAHQQAAGEREQARLTLATCLSAARQCGSRFSWFHAAFFTCNLLTDTADHNQAMAYAKEALTLAHDGRSGTETTLALMSLAYALAVNGETDRAVDVAIESIARARDKRRYILGCALYVGAIVHIMHGSIEAAQQFAQESHPILRFQSRRRMNSAYICLCLGRIDLALNRLSNAKARFVEALAIIQSEQTGLQADGVAVAETICSIAIVCTREVAPDFARIMHLLRVGARSRERWGTPRFLWLEACTPLPPAIDILPTLAICRDIMGDLAFSNAWAAGDLLTLEEAITEALALSADPAPTE
jgi:predicted ATPase/DNA-binding XRE family transcriptional regulator